MLYVCVCLVFFFFQAEDGIRDLVRSRGLGDVYKIQWHSGIVVRAADVPATAWPARRDFASAEYLEVGWGCLLYTSDAADERSSVDLGGRRIIKKKKRYKNVASTREQQNKISEERDMTEVHN